MTHTELLCLSHDGVYHGGCKLCFDCYPGFKPNSLLGFYDYNKRNLDTLMQIEIYCVSDFEFKYYLLCIISKNYNIDELGKITLITYGHSFD